MWVFAIVGLLLIVVIGLVVIGRETARLAAAPRPAVFDLAEAVEFIADRLPAETQARLSHDDVRWILLADADLLEEATATPVPVGGEADDLLDGSFVDEDMAVARIFEAAERDGRELADEDVAAVLEVRLAYLELIGAVGDEVGGEVD